MKAVLYTQSGEKKGEVMLNSSIFGLEFSPQLVHEAIVRQQANARSATAFAKTRAMVAGGGRKPFKQKGSGRARQGSIRAPHMRGGGVVFGPTGMENYSKMMPKKMRRKALFCTLSLRARNEQISVLESFVLESPSTKTFVELLKKMGGGRKVLVVNSEKNMVIEKSVSNIPGVRFLTSPYLNVVDVMQADLLVFLKSGLEKAEEIFTLES